MIWTRPDLTDARHGLQQRRDLHLRDRIIGGRVLQDSGQGDSALLEEFLDLRAGLTDLSGSQERGLTVLSGKSGKCHLGALLR